jgi:hypothetical protein
MNSDMRAEAKTEGKEVDVSEFDLKEAAGETIPVDQEKKVADETTDTKFDRAAADANAAGAEDNDDRTSTFSPAPAKTSARQLSSGERSAPCTPEGKRDTTYWDGPDGVLKRATTFLYRRIIAPAEEGGMRTFFEKNCAPFKGVKKADEQNVEWMALYREYEAMIDRALLDFAATENVDPGELEELVKRAVAGGRTSVNKSLALLVAAGDYSKFVSLMAQKAKDVK